MNELTPLQLLERINAFYDSAWTKLVVAGTLLVVIAGFGVPVLLQWYQRKEAERREKQIVKELEDKSEQIRKDIAKEIMEEIRNNLTKQFDEERKKTEKTLQDFKSEMKKQADDIQGMIFHVQCYSSEALKDYKDTFIAGVTAIGYYVRSKGELNLGRVLSMVKDCLKNLSAPEIDEDITEYFQNLLSSLETVNETGRYTDEIKTLKEMFEQAKKRTPASLKTT